MLINILSTVTYLYTITASAGGDASERVTVLHNSVQPPSLSTIRKRAIARALDTGCSEPYDKFSSSSCRRDVGPQWYSILCYYMNQGIKLFSYHQGMCAENELCIDGPNRFDSDGVLESTAHCVSQDDFINIPQQQSASHVSAPAVGGESYLVQAIMTTQDSHVTQFVQSLRIMAQVAINTPSQWLTLGASQCEHCASVEMAPVPLGTRRVSVDVVLNTDAVAGILWLTELAL